MTNQEKISKAIERFRYTVHDGGNLALCAQMSATLSDSLNLHEQLEGGIHTHHLTESDSHGWAVADGNALVDSGSSRLNAPNEHGSAELAAQKEAVRNNRGKKQKAVFSALMVNPFAGSNGSENKKRRLEVTENPHDSRRFESEIQSMLKESIAQGFSGIYRESVKKAPKQ